MTSPPAEYGPQPELTDGVVVLRPWRDEDIDRAVEGHDEEIAHWFGTPADTGSYDQHKQAVESWRAAYAGGRSMVGFVVEHEGEVVGSVEVRDLGKRTGRLSWTLYAGHRGQGHATRAVRLLVDYAIDALDLRRVEAEVEPGNQAAMRVATRAGLRREGVKRVVPGTGDRPDATEYVTYARLASDPPVTDAEGFRALLNSFLPRKRAIAQMLMRDHDDRVLLCRLTYKQDWDLPGGVVEVHESPQRAVSRELEEELALDLAAGPLLLTDWLPSWSGWDDALCLVFDGGVHDASLVDRIVAQPREIRSAQFCTLEEVREHCADFTARRVEAALANVAGGGPSYTESGR
ncbi:MAG TPA: GNAT family N-acetyltransferase [Nocardioidaceae bacterium]|nr:GNAT family N-acetyltransferase [Nocardioidaceae bacterium]